MLAYGVYLLGIAQIADLGIIRKMNPDTPQYHYLQGGGVGWT